MWVSSLFLCLVSMHFEKNLVKFFVKLLAWRVEVEIKSVSFVNDHNLWFINEFLGKFFKIHKTKIISLVPGWPYDKWNQNIEKVKLEPLMLLQQLMPLKTIYKITNQIKILQLLIYLTLLTPRITPEKLSDEVRFRLFTNCVSCLLLGKKQGLALTLKIWLR